MEIINRHTIHKNSVTQSSLICSSPIKLGAVRPLKLKISLIWWFNREKGHGSPVNMGAQFEFWKINSFQLFLF